MKFERCLRVLFQLLDNLLVMRRFSGQLRYPGIRISQLERKNERALIVTNHDLKVTLSNFEIKL